MVDNSVALRLVIMQNILKMCMEDEKNSSQDSQDITGKKDKGTMGEIHPSSHIALSDLIPVCFNSNQPLINVLVPGWAREVTFN